MKHTVFFLGQWQATLSTNTLQLGDTVKQLEPKAMDVLLLLCQQNGNVLSADDIITQCWGNADIGDNPVHKAITHLRKALGDKASSPTYIETIRKRGYRIIAEVSFPLDEESQAHIQAEQNNWQGTSPYPGLSAFEPSDANIFFGRNAQVTTLLNRISEQIDFGRAFCLVLGPSGTGKSSLINAGVLPKLLTENGFNGKRVVSHTSLDFADIAKGRLFIDIAGAMLDWDIDDIPVFDGMSADTLANALQSDLASVITQCQASLKNALSDDNCSQGHLFLFIDRLEVLLSSPLFDDAQRKDFLDIIETLTISGGVIVFSACRNDFYPLVVNHSSLMAGKANGSHFDLTPPSRAELMQMIRLPAIAANLTWSKDDTDMCLDELLCQEAVDNPDALPMLQYTLQELYLQRSNEDQLEVSVYQSLGGIEGAIGKKAEEVYQLLPQDNQNELAHVLSQLITLNIDDESITSRAARWSHLSNQSQINFVRAMVESRLFVSHLQNGEACFSVAHEALLRRWSRATDWVKTHLASLAIKSRLERVTERWVLEQKSTAYLLSKGKPLQEAITLKNSSMFSLEEQELALIHASQKRIGLIKWLTRGTIALLCMLTFTSVLMSFKSQQAEDLAQEKRLEAESLLGFMVGEFADKLRSVKRMDLLDGISNKALEYFSQQQDYASNGLFSLADEGLNFKARFQHAQTLGAMGEVAYSRAKNDEAKQAFSSAKVILDKLYLVQRDNLELLKTLGANSFWLGQLAYDESEFDVAQPLFEAYRDYSERMNELEPDNIDGQVELYYAYSTLGSLYLKRQNYSQAKTVFESSLALNNRVLELQPFNEVMQSDKADTLSWLADIDLHLGNLSDSLSLKQQGQTILDQLLSNSPDNARIMELLVLSNITQAKIFNIKHSYGVALNKLTVAENLLNKALEQDQNNHYWHYDLLRIQLLKANINAKLSNAHVNIQDNFDELTDTIPSIDNMSLEFFVIIIDYFQSKKQWQESEKYILQAIKELSLNNKKIITSSNKITMLANFEMLKAKQLFKQNKKENAYEVCNETIQRLRPLVNKSQSPYFLVPYVKAYSCIEQLNLVFNELQRLAYMGININQFPQQTKEN